MAFNPSRLNMARRRRGLSKTTLYEKLGISARTLAYYETGEVDPPHSKIEQMASILDFPAEFFCRPDIDEISSDAASFRALKRMTASQEAVAIAAGTLGVEFEQWIRERFSLPRSNVPLFHGVDPDTAAEMVRAEWGLGQRPIQNMIHLVELHGVRVFSLPVESANVDAFSLWHDRVFTESTPFIFLNSTKTGERRRFDVAHELGHLVLHRYGSPENRRAEQEADRFASALLMPKADVLAHIPPGLVSDAKIHLMKRRWQVSAIAMVVRLRQLKVLSEWQYRSLCITLSESGYRKSEKDGISNEQSQILTKVFDALRLEGHSRQAIAKDLAISTSELNALISGLAISSVSPLPTVNRATPKGSEGNNPSSTINGRPKLTLVPSSKSIKE